MSLSPPTYSATEVSEQVHAMELQSNQIKDMIKRTSRRVHQLETSLAENEKLKKQIAELMQQSLEFFALEWKRKDELYPETRLNVLTKAADSVAPKV